MSRTQRIALVLVAVVVAVGGFVIASGGDDDSEAPKQATATTKDATEPTATAEAPPPAPKTTRIRIENGQPAEGVQKVEVKKGEVVLLEVSSSDTTDEVHVHGYDISRELAPGKPATFRFEADKEGEYEVELEGAAVKIASLAVLPA